MIHLEYCFDGLIYRIFAVGGVITLAGTAPFFISRFASRSEPAVWEKQCFLLSGVFGVIYTLWYLILLLNPAISMHRGYFIDEYRDSRVAPPLPLTMAYSFSNDYQPRPVFYLDVFSKKKIFNQEFDADKEYIIYYEEHTNIILKVEEVDLEKSSSPVMPSE